MDPTDLTQYPDAKVAAEKASAERLGERLLVIRPGLIVGPGDPSDRFGYWPARFGRPGPVLTPTTAGRFVQVIDVADLAAYLADAGRGSATGVVNAVGEPVAMADFLRRVARIAGSDGRVVEVPDEILTAHEVGYWAGPRSLPLWLPLADAGFARRSNRRFRETGGELTPLEDTIADVLVDERRRGLDRPRRSGLTTAEEAAVLRAV
ncbi:NAD-dependent epimerase/dehydratase family protein [Microbacterium arborescens]|uniref:NAD-dependent epimerase/dehydratase family protein n=1 Tax=Microbacterium arborescens TaxID=33883 RepID=UPI003C76A1AA